MRQIIEEESFRKAVETLGGARVVDRALDAIAGPLMKNPEGFRSIDVGYGRVYYALTIRIVVGADVTPALLISFTIDEDGTVRMRDVERFRPY